MGEIVEFNTLYSKNLATRELKRSIQREIALAVARANVEFPGVFNNANVKCAITSDSIDEIYLDLDMDFIT